MFNLACCKRRVASNVCKKNRSLRALANTREQPEFAREVELESVLVTSSYLLIRHWYVNSNRSHFLLPKRTGLRYDDS